MTGIRAFAAFWVVCGHLSPQIGALFPNFQRLNPIVNSGYLGVDLFFVLSGFILLHNYRDEFVRVTPGSYGRFLWIRLARLYPVHLFCLLLLLFGLVAGSVGGMHFNMPERMGRADFIRNVFLVHAWGFSADTSWNGPAWSISAEWFAYLIFPIAALLIVRVRSVMASIVLAAVLYAGLLACFARYGTTVITLSNDLALVRVGCEFLVGCLLYQVFSLGWRNPRGWEAIAWLMAASVVGYSFTFPPDRYASLAQAPMLAVLVLALASAKGPMASFLSSRTMIFWGEVSYSLYMTHDILRMVLGKVLKIDHYVASSLPMRAAVLLVYASVIAIAALSTYFLVEKPARRWMRSVVGRGKPIDEAQLPVAIETIRESSLAVANSALPSE